MLLCELEKHNIFGQSGSTPSDEPTYLFESFRTLSSLFPRETQLTSFLTPDTSLETLIKLLNGGQKNFSLSTSACKQIVKSAIVLMYAYHALLLIKNITFTSFSSGDRLEVIMDLKKLPKFFNS